MDKFQFGNTIQRLLEHAKNLIDMVERDIPEALPMAGVLGSTVGEFKHTVFDFPEIYSFNSEIPDSLAVFEVAEKMSGILKSVLLIINDLFPNKVKSGQMQIEIDTTFDVANDTLKKGLEELQLITKNIFNGMNDNVITTTDIKELRKLREIITVMGVDYVNSDFTQIPSQLRGKTVNITNTNYLRQINQIIQPEISSFSNGSNVSQFGNGNMNIRDFSSRAINELKKRMGV